MKWIRYATRADYQADLMLTGATGEQQTGQMWAKVGAKMWAIPVGGDGKPRLVRRRPGTEFLYEIATEQEP